MGNWWVKELKVKSSASNEIELFANLTYFYNFQVFSCVNKIIYRTMLSNDFVSLQTFVCFLHDCS